MGPLKAILLGSALLAVPACACVGPALFNRMAFEHEAEETAYRWQERNRQAALDDLRARAAGLGFPEPGQDPSALRITQRREGEATVVRVAYAFVHPVSILGLCTYPLRVQGYRERIPMDPS